MSKTNTIDKIKETEREAELIIERAEKEEKEILAKVKIDHQNELKNFIDELEKKDRETDKEIGLQKLRQEKIEDYKEEKQEIVSLIKSNKKKAEELIRKEILKTIDGNS